MWFSEFFKTESMRNMSLRSIGKEAEIKTSNEKRGKNNSRKVYNSEGRLLKYLGSKVFR